MGVERATLVFNIIEGVVERGYTGSIYGFLGTVIGVVKGVVERLRVL